MSRMEPDSVSLLAAFIALHCANISAYSAAKTAKELTNCARRLRSIHTRQCNGYRDDEHGGRTRARDENAQTTLRHKMYRIAAKWLSPAAHRFEFGSDPRGPAAHLIFASDNRSCQIV